MAENAKTHTLSEKLRQESRVYDHHHHPRLEGFTLETNGPDRIFVVVDVVRKKTVSK